MSTQELADTLDVGANSIGVTISRNKGMFVQPGGGRWGNRSHEEN